MQGFPTVQASDSGILAKETQRERRRVGSPSVHDSKQKSFPVSYDSSSLSSPPPLILEGLLRMYTRKRKTGHKGETCNWNIVAPTPQSAHIPSGSQKAARTSCDKQESTLTDSMRTVRQVSYVIRQQHSLVLPRDAKQSRQKTSAVWLSLGRSWKRRGLLEGWIRRLWHH